MNKKFLQVIAVCVCFFTACGNNSSTNSTSSFSNSSSVEVSANQEEQEKTDSEAKTDLTEKYKNILEALENEEYDKAIDLISAMKPEPETEVVTIDLNNWTEYFTVEIENENLNYDAMKNIISEGESMNLVIKPEYKERIIFVNGEVGAEVAYEDLVYKVINVNKETGSYETEVMDIDAFKSIWTEYEEQHIASNILSVRGSSNTYYMGTDKWIASTETETIRNDGFPLPSGNSIIIKDADEVTQYIRRPKINIVRIEGELVLSK